MKCPNQSAFPSEEQLALLREMYPPYSRVVLINMDHPDAPPVGTMGTVKEVDEEGTVHVTWDNRATLGIKWGRDLCQPVQIRVPISENLFLVAAAGDDKTYPGEIYIGAQGKNGEWFQDLLIARGKEVEGWDSSSNVCQYEKDKFQLLVYSHGGDDTDDPIEIPLVREEEDE